MRYPPEVPTEAIKAKLGASWRDTLELVVIGERFYSRVGNAKSQTWYLLDNGVRGSNEAIGQVGDTGATEVPGAGEDGGSGQAGADAGGAPGGTGPAGVGEAAG